MLHQSVMPYNNITRKHLLLIPKRPFCAFVRKTIPHAIITTTTVLIAVARFELTPLIPTFAKMEVRAAKTADNNANINHICSPPAISAFYTFLIIHHFLFIFKLYSEEQYLFCFPLCYNTQKIYTGK